MGQHIGAPDVVSNNNCAFNKLTGPCFNGLKTIGVQDKVVPRCLMFGKSVYTRQEKRSGTLLKGHLLKYLGLALHEQAFCQREGGNGPACSIKDCRDRPTLLVGVHMIVNR